MEALNDETNILSVEGNNERNDILLGKRMSFANKVVAPLCRQELYDLTIKEIIELIKNPEIYFDPNKFIHILENIFDCNIFFIYQKNNGW